MSRTMGCFGVVFALALVFAPVSSATTVSEIGDAGNVRATSQAATDPALTRITGAIAGNDQDMYKITVGTTPQNVAFSANTATGSDPRLFLFDSGGHQVAENDDCTTLDAESCIVLTLAPGTYYLAIAGASVPHFNMNGVVNNWTGPGGPSFSYAITLAQGIPHRRNHTPTAAAQTVTTTVNSPVSFTLGAADSDHDPLTYTITTAPLHGTVLCAGAICQYKPDIGFVGTDSLIFTVTDTFGASASAKVTLKVK